MFEPDASSRTPSDHKMAIMLALDGEEFDIIRTALLEHSRSVRDTARPYCTGYSEAGIELCVRLSKIDTLIRGLDHTSKVLSASAMQSKCDALSTRHNCTERARYLRAA